MALPTAQGQRPQTEGAAEVRPITENATAIGRGEDAIVVGQSSPKKPTATTQADGYKTEFVKVYQDAGVIGASMLTLLVLCFLLGVFCLRLLKMYASLTQSRDALDAARFQYSERLTESLLTIRGDLRSVTESLTEMKARDETTLNKVTGELTRVAARIDRLADANVRAVSRRANATDHGGVDDEPR